MGFGSIFFVSNASASIFSAVMVWIGVICTAVVRLPPLRRLAAVIVSGSAVVEDELLITTTEEFNEFLISFSAWGEGRSSSYYYSYSHSSHCHCRRRTQFNIFEFMFHLGIVHAISDRTISIPIIGLAKTWDWYDEYGVNWFYGLQMNLLLLLFETFLAMGTFGKYFSFFQLPSISPSPANCTLNRNIQC